MDTAGALFVNKTETENDGARLVFPNTSSLHAV
jgi:hypothetical protein